MAQYKIRESFADGSTNTMYVRAIDEATALTIAQTITGGQVEVLEAPADVTVTDALATNVGYKNVTVMGKETATGNTTFVQWLFDISKSSDEIVALFAGKTINGVHFDEVTIIRSTSYAAA